MVETGQVEGRHIVRFRGCEGCPLSERCPTVLLKRENVRVLRFTDEEVGASEMRKEMKKDRKKLISRRASVESTVSKCDTSVWGTPVQKCQLEVDFE